MFNKLLGLGESDVVTHFQVYFRRDWPFAVALLLIAGAVAFAFFQYRGEKGVSRFLRTLLATLRAALIASIVLVLWQPVMALDLSSQLRGVVLVLMDVSMPKMDGLAASRAIRARGAAVRQAVSVGMTANARTGDRAGCIEAGRDDDVSKTNERGEDGRGRAAQRAGRPAGTPAAPAGDVGGRGRQRGCKRSGLPIIRDRGPPRTCSR